jgi:gliding motility-associated-like protein
MKYVILITFLNALCVNILAQPSVTYSPSGLTKFQSSESGFLKNYGQVKDIGNKPVSFVYFQSNLYGQQVFVTNYGISILFSRIINTSKKVADITDIRIKGNPDIADTSQQVSYELERVDISLQNAKILPQKITTKTRFNSPEFNLYLSKSTIERQNLINELLVKDVYPGIDWKIYIKEEEGKSACMKYDFIIHPGADPSLIKIKYSKNAELELNNNELKATAKMGYINERMPYSYLDENKQEINVRFALKSNNISFEVADYDISKTLIIDPSIFWLTYLSPINHSLNAYKIFGNDVETDANGNIFVQLSASNMTPFPTLNPGGGAYYQTVSTIPNGSMIISKFSPVGKMLWSTYFGNGVAGKTMTVDKMGNIVAVGYITSGSPSYPNNNPSIPLLNSGGFFDSVQKSIFIVKFSNNGILKWSSYFANFNTSPTDMSYDQNGNIYVVGWSASSAFPVVNPGGGAYVVTNPQYGSSQVLFVSQFNISDNLTWSTRIEGNDYDPEARVCTDKAGNIYIAGHARSTNYPLLNAGGYYNPTAWGAVITRFNPSRQITWSTYYPQPFLLDDITTDDSLNIYIVAKNKIAKFNAATNLIFETSVNTNLMHFWKRIVYDSVHRQIQLLGIMNDIYFGFPTLNTACNGSFFNTGQPPQTFNSATGPIFATINTNGAFTYRSLVDWVPEYYQYFELTVDKNGDPIYIFGHNSNGYAYPNPQLTNPGNGAYFDDSCSLGGSALLLKLNSSELSLNIQVINPNECNCDGTATATPLCGLAPFNYLWSNGATTATVNGLCPGNYWVKVTDANNLTKIVSVLIPYPPGSIKSVVHNVIPENCSKKNGVITIQSVQGGVAPFSYSIDGINYNGNPQFTGLAAGSYFVRVKDWRGCVFIDTVDIAAKAGPSEVVFSVNKTACDKNSGAVMVNNVLGGVSPYLFTIIGVNSNNSGQFTGLAAGSYQLQISDTAGCTLVKSFVVEKEQAPSIAIVSSVSDHCNQKIGGIQVINVAGGKAPYTFSIDSINFVTGTISNLDSGNYSLYIKDSNGCVLKQFPVIVDNTNGPNSSTVSVKNAVCGSLTGEVTVTGVQGGIAPYSYALNSALYSASASFKNVQPGNHILYVKDIFGCTYQKDITITFTQSFLSDLVPSDTIVCYDQTVMLLLKADTSRFKSIVWNIPSQITKAAIKVDDNKFIKVVLTDENGCVVEKTSTLKAKACNTPQNCVWVPNAFTPDKNGRNDKIGPVVNGCRVDYIKFQVFNRYGELVYESKTAGQGWNGFYKGGFQPGGGYVYECEYIAEGIKINKKGTFLLIR